MKKARVIVKTVSALQRIYVEHNGERILYAETDKLPMAKDLVQKAKRELGIVEAAKQPRPCYRQNQRVKADGTSKQAA